MRSKMLEEEIVPDLLDEEMQFLHALHDYSVTEAPHYTLGLPSYAAKMDNRFVISCTKDFRYAEGVHFNPTEDLFRKYRSGQIPGEFKDRVLVLDIDIYAKESKDGYHPLKSGITSGCTMVEFALCFVQAGVTPPACVVESNTPGNFQAIWALETPADRSEMCKIRSSIAEVVGSDKGFSNSVSINPLSMRYMGGAIWWTEYCRETSIPLLRDAASLASVITPLSPQPTAPTIEVIERDPNILPTRTFIPGDGCKNLTLSQARTRLSTLCDGMLRKKSIRSIIWREGYQYWAEHGYVGVLPESYIASRIKKYNAVLAQPLSPAEIDSLATVTFQLQERNYLSWRNHALKGFASEAATAYRAERRRTALLNAAPIYGTYLEIQKYLHHQSNNLPSVMRRRVDKFPARKLYRNLPVSTLVSFVLGIDLQDQVSLTRVKNVLQYSKKNYESVPPFSDFDSLIPHEDKYLTYSEILAYTPFHPKTELLFRIVDLQMEESVRIILDRVRFDPEAHRKYRRHGFARSSELTEVANL